MEDHFWLERQDDLPKLFVNGGTGRPVMLFELNHTGYVYATVTLIRRLFGHFFGGGEV
jgi:hypothetical protein